ncbi:FYVE-type domain-containing protein [Trichostrongylus colubriformis]|uniref:FYVE-type domain-containing protein n=1 Tax=Trichostrongylus colubriformis TaxID=6319 RepID=A0AAN8EV36_TRICO
MKGLFRVFQETVRIELKPPDPVLALDGFSSKETAVVVTGGELSASDESSHMRFIPCSEEGDSELNRKSITDDEAHSGESDHDTEFEEVLQYLKQFDDKDADAVDMPRVSERAVHTDTVLEPERHSDLHESFLDGEEMTQDSDDESLQTTVSRVARAVVNTILDRVEAGIEGATSEDYELGMTKTAQVASTSDDQNIENCSVVDVKEETEAPLCVSSEESVPSGSTDSVSFVTVIHRPSTVANNEPQNQKTEQQRMENEDNQVGEIGKLTEEGGEQIHSNAADFETKVLASSVVQQHQETLEVLEQKQRKDGSCSVELPRGEPFEHELVKGDLTALIRGELENTFAGEEVPEDSTQKSEQLCENGEPGGDVGCEPLEESRSERAGSQESDHGLETAIECEAKEDGCPSPTGPRDRFGAQVISTIHDLSQDTDPTRLTESELQLGKSKPYWIPDDDCTMCMLCNSRFSLLNRRHHCRACGRVACGSCCKEKATLEYMKDDPKKQAQARVCTPCATMLARIEEHEKMMKEHAEVAHSDDTPASSSTSTGGRVSRGVLKTRTMSIAESEAETSQHSDSSEKKRSVVFRDGVKPGAPSSSGEVSSAEEKSSAVKPKKKSRKRHAVARRVAELRLEDELSCALPTATRPQLLVVCPNGEMNMVEDKWVNSRLKEGLPVTVVLKKNLSCVTKICEVNSMSVFCVYSCGFAAIGLDEVVFLWKRDDLNDFSLPLNVLHRIAQIFSSSCDSDQAGVRQVCSRLPAIHSVPIALPPLTRHILFFSPTLQDFSSLSLPCSPFLIALFLNDAEVPWAMACPNRLLFRLGLKYSWYPTPIVNIPGRQAVYSTETSQTVLKVFTDFRSWSFRMKHLAGSTVTLSDNVTLVEIPKSAKGDLEEIVSLNCKMLAWGTSVNLVADSHLVCDEANGMYSTQLLTRGSTRRATGASFVIIDGGLKTNGLQISVVEDGVAIRIPPERLESLLQALNSAENWVTSDDSGTQFTVRWVDSCDHPLPFGPVSPIDGQNLANKFQYGLSLERAILSVLQVNSVSDYGVRLSHVYNLKDGRLPPDDEPKVFSIAEMLARECTGMLEPYLTMLINMSIMSISIRVGVSADAVEYDVSPWFGMEEEQLLYKQNMDQLIPVLYDILGYLSVPSTCDLIKNDCLGRESLLVCFSGEVRPMLLYFNYSIDHGVSHMLVLLYYCVAPKL